MAGISYQRRHEWHMERPQSVGRTFWWNFPLPLKALLPWLHIYIYHEHNCFIFGTSRGSCCANNNLFLTLLYIYLPIVIELGYNHFLRKNCKCTETELLSKCVIWKDFSQFITVYILTNLQKMISDTHICSTSLFKSFQKKYESRKKAWFGLWCSTLFSKIFQIYHDSQ